MDEGRLEESHVLGLCKVLDEVLHKLLIIRILEQVVCLVFNVRQLHCNLLAFSRPREFISEDIVIHVGVVEKVSDGTVEGSNLRATVKGVGNELAAVLEILLGDSLCADLGLE